MVVRSEERKWGSKMVVAASWKGVYICASENVKM